MNHCTKEQLIAFEDRIKAAWEAGELPFLIHLCGGNEDQLIEIFKEINPGDWVFSGHRSHYHYLLSGGDPDELEKKIRRGDSMFVFGKGSDGGPPVVAGGPPMPRAASSFSPETTMPRAASVGDRAGRAPQVNFLTSSVLAGTCGIAAGVAWEIKQGAQAARLPNGAARPVPGNSQNVDDDAGRVIGRPGRSRSPWVWCFLGDGAEDEGHFYEAVNFVHGHDLPCTFVIEDNDRSVDTTKEGRRGKSRTSIGIAWPFCVRRYHYKPAYPHAGSGCKHQIVFNPELVRAYLEESGEGSRVRLPHLG